MAWCKAGVSLASGQIKVRQGFSCSPSLTDNIPHVLLLKRNTNISGLAAPNSGSLGMLAAMCGSFSEEESPKSGGNSHCSAPGSDWRTISSISSLSPASKAEKLMLSDFEGLEVHATERGVPSESTDEGNKSDSHGVGPEISRSPSKDSGVFVPIASKFDRLSCSSTLGRVFFCGNRRPEGPSLDFGGEP